MRLLNIEDLSFQTFDNEETTPPYVIASHCWSGDETTYSAFLEGTNTGSSGYRKVKSFCDFLKQRNQDLKDRHAATWSPIQWIWIDTCCIDKRQSAEVSENITLMYTYYERAEECYAFLSDVKSTSLDAEAQSEVEKCRWFTRGWTLQELLAPRKVLFLSASWDILGHKCADIHDSGCPCDSNGNAMNELLATITQVPSKVMSKQQDPRGIVPEDIYKWAQRRRTTKVEDLAYSLLGLLGVYMLPNYGEKSNAWVRLEEEVSKKLKRDFRAAPPEQISEMISTRNKAAIDAKRAQNSEVAADGCYQSEYVKNLIERHTVWAQSQRAAELSLRWEQAQSTATDTINKATSWKGLSRKLEIQDPRSLVDEPSHLENSSRKPDASNSRLCEHGTSRMDSVWHSAHGSTGVSFRRNTTGHPSKPNLSKLSPAMQSWLHDRADDLSFRVAAGGAEYLPADNAEVDPKVGNGRDPRGGSGGGGGDGGAPPPGSGSGGASGNRPSGPPHDRSSPGGAAASPSCESKPSSGSRGNGSKMPKAKLGDTAVPIPGLKSCRDGVERPKRRDMKSLRERPTDAVAR